MASKSNRSVINYFDNPSPYAGQQLGFDLIKDTMSPITDFMSEVKDGAAKGLNNTWKFLTDSSGMPRPSQDFIEVDERAKAFVGGKSIVEDIVQSYPKSVAVNIDANIDVAEKIMDEGNGSKTWIQSYVESMYKNTSDGGTKAKLRQAAGTIGAQVDEPQWYDRTNLMRSSQFIGYHGDPGTATDVIDAYVTMARIAAIWATPSAANPLTKIAIDAVLNPELWFDYDKNGNELFSDSITNVGVATMQSDIDRMLKSMGLERLAYLAPTGNLVSSVIEYEKFLKRTSKRNSGMESIVRPMPNETPIDFYKKYGGYANYMEQFEKNNIGRKIENNWMDSLVDDFLETHSAIEDANEKADIFRGTLSKYPDKVQTDIMTVYKWKVEYQGGTSGAATSLSKAKNSSDGFIAASAVAGAAMAQLLNTNNYGSTGSNIAGGILNAGLNAIPKAFGGILHNPTYSLVAEEGPEVIIPLSNSKRFRARDLWEKAGSMIGVNMTVGEESAYALPALSGGSGGTSINTPVTIDNLSLAVNASTNASPDAIVQAMSANAQQIAGTISRQIAEGLNSTFANMPLEG